MSIRKRFHYLHRISQAYLGGSASQLSFWHETPEVNGNATPGILGEYYMTFAAKADYAGPFDGDGIPLLDYRGVIGRQHNPIAIAQYGLGNFNLYAQSGDLERQRKFLRIADWLVDHLETNRQGLAMWMHHFDWEYRDTLVAPWYSALAQGQGISLLVRAYKETGDENYKAACAAAFAGFQHDVAEGGITFTDSSNDLWYEEHIVQPPTHILNRFMWASWGVYDYFLLTGDLAVWSLFQCAIKTLIRNLPSFDTGFWTLYEHSGTFLPMLASSFYHKLHIVQLRVMGMITGDPVFKQFAEKWTAYTRNKWNTRRAFAMKALFKVCYY
jgi:heparosan-N-sulfate-glucuronate 5-epimerase